MMHEIETRDYQQRIISKTVDGFHKDGFKSILIESPCGSGKSVVGGIIIKHMQNIDKNLQVGWVAMRRKLLKQAIIEHTRVGVDMNRIHYVSMFDSNPPKVDLMITDEAQHDAAATCTTLHTRMGAKLSLGLSATPYRTDRVKLAYEKIIRDCGVRFLIEEGYLSQFHQYALEEFTPQSVTDAFLNDPNRWGKSVMYFQNEKLCNQACDLLNQNSINAVVMLGSQSLSQRDKMFDDFDNDKLQVLINIYLLTEGFDQPDLQTVWVRDSGKLPTVQMAGRVLRKDPDNPTKIANIVQSIQTRYPYTKTAKSSAEFVHMEKSWRQLGEGPMVSAIVEKVRQRLWSRAVVLPQYINGAPPRITVNSSGVTVAQPVSHKNNKNDLDGLFNTNSDD